MLKAFGVFAAILIVLLLFVSAWPVSPVLTGVALLLWFLKTGSRGGNTWAKALATTLMPVCIALSMLAIVAMLSSWMEPDAGSAVLTAEDRLALRLYHLLKPISPSWWLYTLILLGATWMSRQEEHSSALSHVKTAKKWFGKTLATVTMLASLTLASDTLVVSPHLDAVRSRLKLQYENAKKRKEQASYRYLAEKTVTAALHSMSSADRVNFQQVFETLGRSSATLHTEEDLGAAYAKRDAISLAGLHTPTPVTKVVEPQDSDSIAAVAHKVQAEVSAANKAEAIESEAQKGLQDAAGEVLGEGNGAVLQAASEYLSRLADQYAGQYAEAIKPLIDDFLQPVTSKATGAYLDRLIHFAAGRCHWNGLPHAGGDLIALQLQVDAVALHSAGALGATVTSQSEARTLLAESSPLARTGGSVARAGERESVAEAGVALGAAAVSSAAKRDAAAAIEREAAAAAAHAAEKDVVGAVLRTLVHAL